ncbi:MAG: hypothetical protein JXM75_13465, partial [Chromatiaceae bacterium]|nr:hypothetical protein [Chromatiaceae bacterium]
MSDVALKCWAYPDGSFDGHAVYYAPTLRTPAPLRGGFPDGALRAAGAAEADNRKRSIRRTRQAVVRIVRHQAFDTLGTLTVGGAALPAARDFLDLAAEWWRRYGSEIVGNASAVFVVEYGGENGRIHVHFATRLGAAHVSYTRLIASWSAFLTRRGYISPTGTHRVHVSRRTGSRKLGRYLAKYLQKAFDAGHLPAGAHRYRVH